MKKRIYITTAIDYVNGAPHMGHALEKIYTDAIARGHRMLGYEVRFQTGTDEHGVKIFRTAQEKGMETQAFTDLNAGKFMSMKEAFHLSYDDFIRTTDKVRHWPSVKKLWEKLNGKGFLEKRNYTALYCSGCESFVQEKDLVEGKCPDHNRAPEEVSEENWFFKLSTLSDKVEKMLKTREVAIQPEFRAKEILNVVGEGLQDVSFSRPKETLPWGVPVPDDEKQVMYVWCDALTNYISALGYAEEGEEFQKFWEGEGKRVHVIGKDITRFHAAIWLGMLDAVGLKKPTEIVVHGFITSEGKKMGKSLGNVVDPMEVAEVWGAEVLRWYLLSEIPFGQDGDFSKARFAEKYQAELGNNIGNLCSRVGNLCEKNLGGELVGGLYEEVRFAMEEVGKDLESLIEKYDLHSYAKKLMEYFSFLNGEVERLAPWKMAKEGTPEELATALTSLAQGIYLGAVYLSPLMPEVSAKILAQFAEEMPESFEVGRKVRVTKMTKGEILFPRKEETK